MSTYRDDLTVLIQGPYNRISLDRIDNYKKYGKVSISCWDSITEEQKIHLHSTNADAVTIKPLPDLQKTNGVLKDSTFFYAISSIYHGLKDIDTKYVIKTRSDEHYNNLDCFIDEFMADDNKIVCGNIFVRSNIPFHFGDHIFVCKTQDLLRAVEDLILAYKGIKQIQPWMQQSNHSAETILCCSILNQKKQLHNKNPRQIFLDNISIIDVNRTGNFICQWQHGRRVYENNFINHHGVKSNDDY